MLPPPSTTARVIGCITALASGALIMDRYADLSQRREALQEQYNYQTYHDKAYYKHMNYYSSNGVFDQAASVAEDVKLDVQSWWQAGEIWLGGLVDDLVVRNWQFWGLLGAGLAVGARDWVVGAGRKVGEVTGPAVRTIADGVWDGLRNLSMGGTISRGLLWGARQIVEKPLPVLLGVGATAWIVNKFMGVWSGDEQRDYFTEEFQDLANGNVGWYG